MYHSEEKYRIAAKAIQDRCSGFANAAIIIGTGLGEYFEREEAFAEINYSEIPGFPLSTVEGHSGKMKLLSIGNKKILCLFGRFHYYEGYNMSEVTFAVRVLNLLGIDQLLISNVSGGLDPDYQQGDLVFIKDHINMLPENPLRGKNIDSFGPRFPDMLNCYNAENRAFAADLCNKYSIKYKEGVYVSIQGPNLETPAEYNMYHKLGADLIGMSTVPEVIVAHHAGMNILACSIVSNVCYPIEKIERASLESVLKIAKAGSAKLGLVFKGYIEESEKIF
jgi:purine-nucleoside phosphorylase